MEFHRLLFQNLEYGELVKNMGLRILVIVDIYWVTKVAINFTPFLPIRKWMHGDHITCPQLHKQNDPKSFDSWVWVLRSYNILSGPTVDPQPPSASLPWPRTLTSLRFRFLNYGIRMKWEYIKGPSLPLSIY